MSFSSVSKDSKWFSLSRYENTVRKNMYQGVFLSLLLAPRVSASSLYFSAFVAFLQITVSASFSLEFSEECHVNDQAFLWVLLTLSSDGSHAGPFCWGKKCHQQLFRALLPSKHNRGGGCSLYYHQINPPRNQGWLQNRFFSYAIIKYQKIYPEKTWHLVYCELQPTQEESKASEVKNNLSNV